MNRRTMGGYVHNHRLSAALLVFASLACSDKTATNSDSDSAPRADSRIGTDSHIGTDSRIGTDSAIPDSGSGGAAIPWDADYADFFPIGVWYVRGSQPASITHDSEMKDLRKEGFNTIVLSLEPTIPDVILPAAAANKLRVIPYMHATMRLLSSTGKGTITEQQAKDALTSDSIALFKASPATLGYYIYDEPNPYVMNAANLGTVKNGVEKLDANNVTLSAWNIRENMQALAAGAAIDVLFMDEYPLATGKAVGDLSDAQPTAHYGGKDLPTFSEYQDLCMATVPNVPAWVIVQAFEGTSWRRPTPKELRLQVFTSVMHGARGLIYFIYQTEWPAYRGLRDENYAATDLLTEAIDINAKLNALAPTLLQLRRDDSTAVTANAGQVNEFGMPTAEAKAFKHQRDGAEYVVAVNNDVTSATEVALAVDASKLGSTSGLKFRDILTGEVIPYQVSGTKLALHMNIAAGDGRVLRLE